MVPIILAESKSPYFPSKKVNTSGHHPVANIIPIAIPAPTAMWKDSGLDWRFHNKKNGCQA